MEEHSESPSLRSLIANFLVVIGCFAIFGVLVYVTYVANRVPDTDSEVVAIREQRYAEVISKSVETAKAWEWIDESAGKIRVPIDFAIELTGQRLQKGEPLFSDDAP